MRYSPPITEEQSQLYDRVLAFCNRVRRRYHLAPRPHLLRGRQGDAHACPVARTLGPKIVGTGDGVGGVTRSFTHAIRTPAGRSKKGAIRNPAVVSRFVFEFDLGWHPALLQPWSASA